VERLAHECPNDEQTLLSSAMLSYDAKQFVQAQMALDRLFALHVADPEAAVLRARIALDQGNLPFAVRFLSEQIQASPDHAGLREVYASALYLSRRNVEALENLTIAERLGAPNWRIAYHRGVIAETQGNPAEAAKYYEAALQLRPGWRTAEARLQGIRAHNPRN
jgi:tetratricopeptide (TPR) repeat protein